jgi:DUF4097 and DUF4098 domain-containing protein YvlB
MMKMKFVLVAAVLLPWLVEAQNHSGREPYLVKSLAKETVQKARVETTGGNIAVAGVDASEARVEMYVSPNNGDENLSRVEIQKRLDEYYEFKISVDNNLLKATARLKDHSLNWKKSLSISFKLFIPRNCSTDLSTSGGNINLIDLSGGTQDFTTSGGDLDLNRISGKITGRTSGGNVNVSNAKDDIDLSTSGGDVKAIKCLGKIKLVTSGGSVRGDGIEGELSAHTSGGDVRLESLNCSLETSTSGGDIEVSMDNLGKYVRIQNSGGDISLEIPKNKGMDLRLTGDRIEIGELSNFSGRKEENEVNGKMNGGGIPVTVDGGDGRVSLTFK